MKAFPGSHNYPRQRAPLLSRCAFTKYLRGIYEVSWLPFFASFLAAGYTSVSQSLSAMQYDCFYRHLTIFLAAASSAWLAGCVFFLALKRNDKIKPHAEHATGVKRSASRNRNESKTS